MHYPQPGSGVLGSATSSGSLPPVVPRKLSPVKPRKVLSLTDPSGKDLTPDMEAARKVRPFFSWQP